MGRARKRFVRRCQLRCDAFQSIDPNTLAHADLLKTFARFVEEICVPPFARHFAFEMKIPVVRLRCSESAQNSCLIYYHYILVRHVYMMYGKPNLNPCD